MNCLFQDITTLCQGIRKEHLLQRCVGGTWEEDDVICAKCNEDLSVIDVSLCRNFEMLMVVLAPFISGNLKNKKIKEKSREGVPLEITAGGVVGISKTKAIQDNDGLRIYSYSESAANIAADAQQWPSGRYVGRKLPVSQLAKLGTRWIYYDLMLYRAIMKCLIEILDKVSRRDKKVCYARRPELQPIRKFIRYGFIGGPVVPNFLPIFRLDDEIDRLFPSISGFDFTNRVAIFYDSKRGKLFGLMQIAGTIPLGGYLNSGLDWSEPSFSYLYEKRLIRGENLQPHEQWLEYCALDERVFSFHQFVINSKQSQEFAIHALGQSINDRTGRAYAFVDMNSDDILTNLMHLHYESLVTNQNIAHDDALVLLIEIILRSRYQDNSITQSRWSSIRSELRMSQLDTRIIYDYFIANKTFGPATNAVLAIYRGQLTRLIEEFGYPIAGIPARLIPDIQ